MPILKAMPQGFWPQITHQLERIVEEKPSTFEQIREILNDPAYTAISERPAGDSAFFAGSGGDATLYEALRLAGWQVGRYQATYHYVMSNNLTGEEITYIEGDVVPDNQFSKLPSQRTAKPVGPRV
jgi:hypothetical protein